MAKQPNRNEDKPRIADLPRFRLIPVTMCVAVVLLCVKTNDIVGDVQKLMKGFVAPDVIAEETPADKPKEDAKKEDATAEGKKDETKADDKKDAEKKPDEKADAEKKPEGDKKAALTEEPKKEPEDPNKKIEENKAAADAKGEDKDPKLEEPKKEFSPIEVDILQSLSKRREEIDQWAKQVEVRENLLKATEMRIDGKVGDMNKLKKDIEGLLAQYQTQEDTKLKSLVKIYENMKPKDAATIFNEMEMPILLQIVDRMSERKAAPILAGMNPTRAKELTTELAEQRKLDQPTVDAAGAAAASATPAAAGASPKP